MSSTPLHTSGLKAPQNADLPLRGASLPASFVREFRAECLDLLDLVERHARQTDPTSPHSIRLSKASAGLSYLLGFQERSHDWIAIVERQMNARDNYRAIAEGHLEVAQLRTQAGDRSAALRCIERAVELGKQERKQFSVEFLAQCGVMYWRAGACVEARKLWSAIRSSEALVALTQAELDVSAFERGAGRIFESIQALQRASYNLDQVRDSSEKLHLQEAIYIAADRLGDHELRREILFKIRELGEWAVEHDPRCGFEVARFLYRARFTREARKVLSEAVVNYGAMPERAPTRLPERMRRAAENDAQLEILKAWASVGSVGRTDQRLKAITQSAVKILILEDLLDTKIAVGRPPVEIVNIARDLERLTVSVAPTHVPIGYRMILAQSYYECGKYQRAFAHLKTAPADDFAPSLLPMAFSIAVHAGEHGYAKSVITQFFRHRYTPELLHSGQYLLGLYDFARAMMRFAGVE